MSLEIAAFQSVPSHNSANGEIIKLDSHNPTRTRKKKFSVNPIIDILEKNTKRSGGDIRHPIRLPPFFLIFASSFIPSFLGIFSAYS